MIKIEEFDDVFRFNPKYHHSSSIANAITNNRRALHKLFFDRLLNQLQVKGVELYPPHDNNSLRQLHRQIVQSQNALHFKQSLLFYLLKDCKAEQGQDPAEDFAKGCYLPPKYWVFMQGLWLLDHLQFEAATEYLTQPSLTATFPTDILSILLEHSSSTTTTAPASPDLALSFFHTISPPLTPHALLTNTFSHLCAASLSSAYFFLRSQPAHTHRSLLEVLITSALTTPQTAPSSAANQGTNTRAERGVELVDLPLTNEEEEWFEQFLLEGKGRGLHGARDTVMMRRVARGRVGKALEEGRHLAGRRIEGLSWEGVREGLGRGTGGRGELGMGEWVV
ncbi:nuclear pore complex assembly-domain-containing protein [Lineolata rhizophorae]|uniref:Nuclear pore complex assembly-domain-containing protein n=1 Tax=Lineolata rhizophorae TaxID=578093 RepID=A0A6A6P6E4_9PEZI|nr:nuclear pore complex assembly-domain-containing protein [Lineolata rhizophorae]